MNEDRLDIACGKDGSGVPAEDPAAVVCPKCGGHRWQLYGYTLDGRQKYKCKDLGCRHSFTMEPRGRRIDDKTRKTVISLLEAGTKPKVIAAALPDIKLRWIYDLKRRMKHD